jgi:hypothetical protein
VVTKRSFGQPPLQAKRTSQSRQFGVSVVVGLLVLGLGVVLLWPVSAVVG